MRQLEDDVHVLAEAGRLDQPVLGRCVDRQTGLAQRGGHSLGVLRPDAEVDVVLEVPAAAVGVHGDAPGQREEVPAPLQHGAHLLGRLQDGLIAVAGQLRAVVVRAGARLAPYAGRRHLAAHVRGQTEVRGRRAPGGRRVLAVLRHDHSLRRPDGPYGR